MLTYKPTWTLVFPVGRWRLTVFCRQFREQRGNREEELKDVGGRFPFAPFYSFNALFSSLIRTYNIAPFRKLNTIAVIYK